MAKSKTASRSRAPARKTSAARSTALALADTEAPSTSVAFGVILDINGTPVPVSADDLSNLKTKGVEFTLQNPIMLGSIDDFEKWVNDQFKVQLPQPTDFPGVLQPIVTAITGIKVTVEKAHLKVPGSDGPPGVMYTLQANGMFASPISLIPNVLGVSGFVFGFSNEAADSGS